MEANESMMDLRVKNSPTEIQKDASRFEKELLLQQFMDAVPNVVLVLNMKRQAVFANLALMQMLGLGDNEHIVGLRPGEILGCLHAGESESGCGTTEYCRLCGALTAILQSQEGLSNIQEYHLKQQLTGESHDYRVHAAPLDLEGQKYTIFTLEDVSNENRRRALERIFFHDVLNTAGGLKGYLELITRAPLEEQEEMLATALSQARLLIAEIQAQKNLAAAEDARLVLSISTLDSIQILRELADLYDEIAAEGDKDIRIDPASTPFTFISDEVQVNRVLGNLVKNAIEATPSGKNISIGCRLENSGVEFWVQNPYVIPPLVRLKIFERSFSTKSNDRGLGTYSVKLITERYLKGTVSFTSDFEGGTVFRVRLPRSLQMD